MADEEKTEETKTTTTDETNSWGRMKSLIGETVREELGKWQGPAVSNSQPSSPTQTQASQETTQETSESPKRTDRDPKRKQGFLSNFFQGLE